MGKKQSWDNAWDVAAMSNYNTITSLSESPKQEGLIYAGTDDGIIQVSENGGGDWRTIEVNTLAGVPPRAFVNDIKADLFDASTVYVALDDHKSGDFRPMLLRSDDRGRTWRSIAGDLPDRHLIWSIQQDHVDRNLIFAGTKEPCAHLILKSLGLPESETRVYSEKLCGFIEQQLGVPPSRTYIEFISPERHMFGWDKRTF